MTQRNNRSPESSNTVAQSSPHGRRGGIGNVEFASAGAPRPVHLVTHRAGARKGAISVADLERKLNGRPSGDAA